MTTKGTRHRARFRKQFRLEKKRSAFSIVFSAPRTRTAKGVWSLFAAVSPRSSHLISFIVIPAYCRQIYLSDRRRLLSRQE